MVETILKNYYKYQATIKWMLVCVGLWPKYEKHPYFLKVFLTTCAFTFSLIISGGTLLYGFRSFENSDITGATKGFGVFLGAFAVNLRVFIIHKTISST